MLFKYKYNPQTLPVEKLQERIHIVDEQLADPAKVSEIFTKLVQSLRDCCRVKLWYYAANSRQNTERVVEPYGLICKRHNWYLVAFWGVSGHPSGCPCTASRSRSVSDT